MSFHTSADRDAALAALDKIIDPRSGKGLAAAGLVQGLVLREGRAGFMLEVPAVDAARYGYIREAAEKALAGLPGIEKAQVVLTASATDRIASRASESSAKKSASVMKGIVLALPMAGPPGAGDCRLLSVPADAFPYATRGLWRIIAAGPSRFATEPRST